MKDKELIETLLNLHRRKLEEYANAFDNLDYLSSETITNYIKLVDLSNGMRARWGYPQKVGENE